MTTKISKITDTCSICLNAISSTTQGPIDAIQLKCRHLFHTRCSQNWQKTQQAMGLTPTCALCRTQIVKPALNQARNHPEVANLASATRIGLFVLGMVFSIGATAGIVSQVFSTPFQLSIKDDLTFGGAWCFTYLIVQTTVLRGVSLLENHLLRR